MTTSMMTKFVEAMGGTVEICTHEFGVTGAMFTLFGVACQMTAFRETVNIFVLEGEDKGKVIGMPMTTSEFVQLMTEAESCAV